MNKNTVRLVLVLLLWIPGCDEQPQHGQLDSGASPKEGGPPADGPALIEAGAPASCG
jgi:hypothetical protein